MVSGGAAAPTGIVNVAFAACVASAGSQVTFTAPTTPVLARTA